MVDKTPTIKQLEVTKSWKNKKNSKNSPSEKSKKSDQTREEPEPILSGRMIIAVIFALGISVFPTLGPLGKFITKKSPRTTERANWVVGQTAKVHLTVVTSDYRKLGCASEKSLKGSHCEWKSAKEIWPKKPGGPVDDSKASILQPYRTTDKQLLLLPGLWAQPEVAMRVHTEPSRGVGKSKLARFVIACEVKFLEEWEKPMIRWNANEKWTSQGKAMVADILDCTILEDEKG